MLIGVVVLAMAFAEGSANDWLPLLMVDGHGFSPTSGSLIYAGFTLGMTVGRFTGGWFIDRYSRVAVVRASALLGGLGIAMIIFVDVDWIAGVSVILWGLGHRLASRSPFQPPATLVRMHRPASAWWLPRATSPSWWGHRCSASSVSTTGCAAPCWWC